MAERRIGLIMNGVTGRMGMNQHLIRSIAAIRKDGGVALANGDRVMPDPILVGRNRDKLEALAKAHGIARVSTDLDACLADPAAVAAVRSDVDLGLRVKVEGTPTLFANGRKLGRPLTEAVVRELLARPVAPGVGSGSGSGAPPPVDATPPASR